MRQLGERIGAPAATVSQVEKGQRALKEPKIEVWASALGIEHVDLLELWWLSQGEVLVEGRRTFYAEAGESLGSGTLRASIVKELERRPDLEPIYRLAELIAAVLKRALPHLGIQVEPLDCEPPYLDEGAADIALTAAQQDEQAEYVAAFVPLPVIDCYWDDARGQRSPVEINARSAVRVPLLEELGPIVRRRAKSVKTVELEDLIRGLSGPERERVRGYVEAIVEQRQLRT